MLLQCIAVYCSELQCVAVCGSVLQRADNCEIDWEDVDGVAFFRQGAYVRILTPSSDVMNTARITLVNRTSGEVCCSVLQCIAVLCSVWQGFVVCCSALQTSVRSASATLPPTQRLGLYIWLQMNLIIAATASIYGCNKCASDTLQAIPKKLSD